MTPPPATPHAAAPYADLEQLYDDPFAAGDGIAAPTQLDEAWELVEQAWDTQDAAKRIKLARVALKCSPDVAGAYYLLAQSESSPDVQLALCDQAIAASARAFAPQSIESLAPHAWIDPDVDCAMDAMLLRAIALFDTGRPEEAIAQLRRLVELDPSDRVRARTPLTLQLISSGRIDEAIEVDLENDLDESDPTCAFARPLLRFMRDGDTIFARRALAEATLLYPEHAALLAESLLAPNSTETGNSMVMTDDDARLEQFVHQELGAADDEELSLDPIADRPQLAMRALHRELWHSTPGAGAWLKAMLIAGPKIRYETGRSQDRPHLVLTENKMRRYRHCPRCQRPTDFHPLDLVAMFDPDQVVDFEVNARRCPECDIVCIAEDDIASRALKSDPDLEGRDFVPLGYLPVDEKRADADAAWLRARLRPWRSFEDYDVERTEWPTVASMIQEVDDLLARYSSVASLGPVGSLFGLIGPPDR